MRPRVIIDADHPHAEEADRIVDQQFPPRGEDRVFGGVPGSAQTRSSLDDGLSIDDNGLQRTEHGVPGRLRSHSSCHAGVLAPHGPAVQASVAADSQQQPPGLTPQWGVSKTLGGLRRTLRHAARTTADTSRPSRARSPRGPSRGHRSISRSQSGSVDQVAERIEIRGRVDSVGHVEVFPVNAEGTSIFGRPRRLPPHRHAGRVTSSYIPICKSH